MEYAAACGAGTCGAGALARELPAVPPKPDADHEKLEFGYSGRPSGGRAWTIFTVSTDKRSGITNATKALNTLMSS